MTNFKAFTYDGKKTARKVLNAIEDTTEAYVWVDDVALISVDKKGHIKVHSTWAQDSSNVSGGISLGALTGGMLGLLFGPGGALAGAAVGGSIGGLIGHHENVKIDDPALNYFAASLVNDSSALILLADEDVVAEFAAAVDVADYEGAVYDAVLDDAAVAALQQEMEY